MPTINKTVCICDGLIVQIDTKEITALSMEQNQLTVNYLCYLPEVRQKQKMIRGHFFILNLKMGNTHVGYCSGSHYQCRSQVKIIDNNKIM